MRALRTLLVSALLLSCAAPAPAADAPTKQELELSVSRLKQIGIAFHGWADDNGDKWADDIHDKDGRFLLSWRVRLLPYLGDDEKKLYKEFKLDEPWDSSHNKKLIEKMPKVYAPVRVKAKAGETYYQRFVGKDAIFTDRGTAYTIPTIPDGTSNTALVAEAGAPVIWTQPGDIPFNRKAPLPGLGGMFDGQFHMVLCDGSVIRIKKDFDADELKKVIMPADGMIVDLRKLSK